MFRVRVAEQMDAVIISARVIAIYPPRMVWGWHMTNDCHRNNFMMALSVIDENGILWC